MFPSIIRRSNMHDNHSTPPEDSTHALDSAASPDRRRIRSFTRRQGRITEGQRKALESLWDLYGLANEQEHGIDAWFPEPAPLILEIGFGNGDTLAETAAANPQTNFLGVEVHRPGIGHFMLQANARYLTNVRIFCADAIEILHKHIPNGSLMGINVFFPDPWPKRRHHKRRLINDSFLELAARKMKTSALLHIATDWEDYAEQMIAVADGCRFFEICTNPEIVAQPAAARPLTKFERRGKARGHQIWDLIYRRK